MQEANKNAVNYAKWKTYERHLLIKSCNKIMLNFLWSFQKSQGEILCFWTSLLKMMCLQFESNQICFTDPIDNIIRLPKDNFCQKIKSAGNFNWSSVDFWRIVMTIAYNSSKLEMLYIPKCENMTKNMMG